MRDHIALNQRDVRPGRRDDQAFLYPLPGDRQIKEGPGSVLESDIKRIGGKDGAVPVVKLRPQVAEGGLVALLLVHLERLAQHRRPVGLDHVEVGIEMLEDVPGDSDRAPLLARRQGA